MLDFSIASFSEMSRLVCLSAVAVKAAILVFGKILFNSHKPEMINPDFWENLQKKYNLQCAHFIVQGKFKGCINDYLKESNCTTFKK